MCGACGTTIKQEMQLRQAKTPAGAAYLIKNAAAGGVQPLFIILYYLLFIRKGATLMFTLAIVQSALELGFIYALVAMALFLSFRVLNIADMTTDGAFTLGCAVSATAAVAGHPFLGFVLAMLAGA